MQLGVVGLEGGDSDLFLTNWLGATITSDAPKGRQTMPTRMSRSCLPGRVAMYCAPVGDRNTFCW